MNVRPNFICLSILANTSKFHLPIKHSTCVSTDKMAFSRRTLDFNLVILPVLYSNSFYGFMK